MATDGGGIGPIEVRCPDYFRRCRDVAAAVAFVEAVERHGACRFEHVITDYTDPSSPTRVTMR